MAKTSSCKIEVGVLGDGETSTFVPSTSPVLNTACPVGGMSTLSLSSGDNTISVPSGAIGIAFSPSSSSTVVKKLKGAGGDTGVTIRANAPSVVYLPDATASFILNASTTESLPVHWL